MTRRTSMRREAAQHEDAMPMSRSRPRLKLIAIGFNTYGTGLTRVMHGIMRRLADRHEIHYLGIGYSGETVRDRGLTIHPTNPRGGDIFAAFQAKTLIEEIDPALVFILHDIWYFEHYLRILGPYRDRLKIACYIPLDGKIVNEKDAAALKRADRVVVYTQFARNEFEGAFDRLRAKRAAGEARVSRRRGRPARRRPRPLPPVPGPPAGVVRLGGPRRREEKGVSRPSGSGELVHRAQRQPARPEEARRSDHRGVRALCRRQAGECPPVPAGDHGRARERADPIARRALRAGKAAPSQSAGRGHRRRPRAEPFVQRLRRRHHHVDGRGLGPRQLRARRRRGGPDRSRPQRAPKSGAGAPR